MEVSTNNKSCMQPRPILELLPSLGGILTKDAMQTLASMKKAPRTCLTTVQPRTVERTNIRPMTLAEMRDDLQALKPQSSRRTAQVQSAKKRGWNSSVKVDYKKISHTADGQMKNNPVRKVLNFQPPAKPKPANNSRMTVAERLQNVETPKFPKPEFRPKKSIHIQSKSFVRISGVGAIPQTPLETKLPIRNRKTIANKENSSFQANVIWKPAKLAPTPVMKKVIPPKIDTPLMNSSWKSGSDASFLQKEKEINEVEEKVKAILEEQTLEKIADVSPPNSTPFKEYRSVQEFFNNSDSIENSAVYNDTIMCFEKPSACVDSENREESLIMSLCDLFNRATVVTNNDKKSTELDNLVEVEKQTVNNIKVLEHTIELLTNIKKSQANSLQNVRKLIVERKNSRKNSETKNDKTLVEDCKHVSNTAITKTPSTETSPIISRPCSVIRSTRSPTYKIPKKNSCLRKKVISKSMPIVSNLETTPVKDFEGKALNMYMKMKEHLNFLSTPMVNRDVQVPNTPALTSHNLQKQLDKLFAS